MTHPAKFSNAILEHLDYMLPNSGEILDPFAGTGKIRNIRPNTVCVELEPEWARECGPPVVIADSTKLPFLSRTFDAAVTSPTYGNRMADHHDAKDLSKRNTYKHRLGRDLHPRNTGQMQWGEEYREIHRQVYDEVYRVLKPGGMFVVNVADHIRRGKHEAVAEWHLGALLLCHFHYHKAVKVVTPGLRHGENYDVRLGYEWILQVFK